MAFVLTAIHREDVAELMSTDLGRRPAGHDENMRAAERVVLTLPARLTWKDQRGADRSASVVTRNLSEHGVYVECQSVVSISLFRLVQFQFERKIRASDPLPEALRQGKVLSAVYRVSPQSSSGTTQLALRLMVAPRRLVVRVPA
jgi:hypothetical protein